MMRWFTRGILLPALGAAIVATAAAPAVAQRAERPPAVRVWEEEVVIPTYPLGPDDPNPHYAATSGSIIYPYTMQDGFTTTRVDRTYRAVFLENEYLRIMCLPELGGRIQSVFDKTANQEMFYRNRVIRPGHIALRGAWISGGIEWNRGPQGHTVTSFSPVDVLPVQNPDGSASLLIGNVEKNYRTGWQVTLTLRPAQKVLDERIRLYNPTDGFHPYYFWNNTAFPNTAGTRFVYPMTLGMDHAGTTFFDWPVHEGRDLRWLRNYPEPTSVFGYEVEFDFFGAYDVDRDFGIVQVADHHVLPGKKAWTWGESDAGRVAQQLLTDEDGPYIEVQSGPLPTQNDLGRLAPGQEISWQESWYPVAGLGDGFEYATRDVAIQRQPLADGVRFRFAGTRQIRNAELVISRQDGRIENRRLALSPAAVEVIDVRTADSSPEPATMRMRLRLQDADGNVLVDYSSPLEIPAKSPPEPADPPADSAETRYLAADAAERRGDVAGARSGYRSALELDPAHAGSLRALGSLELEAGRPEAAEPLLAAAVGRVPVDGLSWYLLGVARLRLDRLDEAREAASLALQRAGTGALGHSLRGRIAARRGDYSAALEEFTAGLSVGGSNWTRLLDQVLIAAYAAGENDQAQFLAQQSTRAGSLRLVPHLLGALAAGDAIPEFARRLRVWVGEPEFAFIEASLAFADLGLYRDAAALLEAACWAAVPASERRPLPAYYMAWFHARRGDDTEAAHWLDEAAGTTAQHVFPSRPEALAALGYALEQRPEDARAALYLGNLLAGLARHDEAAVAWERAYEGNTQLAVAARNLGLHAWKLEGDTSAAVDWLRRAIAANSSDQTLYRDLGRVLVERNERNEAVRLLESMPLQRPRRADITVDLARSYVALGRHDDALALLAGATFTNREGNSDPHRVFYDAHVERGVDRWEAGDHAGALSDFEAALTYPEHLGVGRPHRPREARAQYWRGYALEALGRPERALEAWRECAAASPLDDEQREFLALCAERLER